MLNFCKEFHVDPVDYFLETDTRKQIIRDAAATVLYDQARREQLAAKS